MTDLINSLADSIIALINANPRSPTKEEIATLLGEHLFVQDSGTALYKLPGKHCELPPPCALPSTELMEIMDKIAADVRAATAIDGDILQQWEDEQNRTRYLMGLPPVVRYSKP